MEPEILEFASSIGATEPEEGEEIYGLYRSLFKEHNYFRHPCGFLVVKVSRSKKPFWGLHKAILQFLDENLPYNLILLTSASQGWLFTQQEVASYIHSKAWNLDGTGKQYKINMPLPDGNMFFGPKGCLKRLGSRPDA
jgi:hypothetical protein